MATGAIFKELMYSFWVADSTISKLIPTVLDAIVDTFLAEVMPPLIEPDEWREVSTRFNTKWISPHAFCAFGGKHIPIKALPNSGSLRHDYKGFFFMILLALADADYKYCSASDCQVFNESELRELVEGGKLGFPDPEPLPDLTENLPYFFLGDEAFPLRTWMMKLYSRMGLGHDERIFNYRLSRSKGVLENANGILANRFLCLCHATVYKKTESVKSLVIACVMLHNLLRTHYPGVPANADQEDQNHALVPGVWRREESQLVDAGGHAGRKVDNNLGKQRRNYLKDYFMSEAGSVPWQE